VYILQPSGATGFGQAFSARHVNDWSRTTADEVLAATEAFLAAHPSADPERVGCIGASYGGFLTMRLATRSDRFGAAISHAGISNIAAYWGEGWWGHLYSALATAESYPWNAREIYVEQSPLFHADKITTPLLLLHGTEDMNVPLGESDSLFTALKVLGRDVEYVQYQGEGHWILDYPKRRQWHQTIVAYFDWKLKGDASWWEALYPE
jgi:dipeptidyl aminopeptidase/acylaminoacyl peptidase